jgi:hypothetical protein
MVVGVDSQFKKCAPGQLLWRRRQVLPLVIYALKCTSGGICGISDGYHGVHS